jgi:ribosomal 50S subunit-recycling heat shock protein
MKIRFGTKKVQKMGRVVFTEALMSNADIKVGDSVDLYFDTVTKAIIVERTAVADAPAADTSNKRTEN